MNPPAYPGVADEHGYAFDLIDLKACCKKRGPAYKEPFFWETTLPRPSAGQAPNIARSIPANRKSR